MTTIIIGLTVREAEHHWRELCETRPELRRDCLITSVDVGIRKLQGRRPDNTEVIEYRTAFHPRARELAQELRVFRSKATTNGDQ